MGHLVLLSNNNRRLNVESNHTNVPIGENGKNLRNYIGVVVRTYVPIDIMDWRAILKELKNKIWENL